MAKIKPFKGLRPPKDLVTKVVARPYDVLNSAEARAEAAGNEMSLYRITRPEIDFAPDIDEHDECVYERAASNFKLFQDNGWLIQDKEDRYYIYAQKPWATISNMDLSSPQMWMITCKGISRSMN